MNMNFDDFEVGPQCEEVYLEEERLQPEPPDIENDPRMFPDEDIRFEDCSPYPPGYYDFDAVQNEIEADRMHEIGLLESQLASAVKLLYKSGQTAEHIKGYVDLAIDEVWEEIHPQFGLTRRQLQQAAEAENLAFHLKHFDLDKSIDHFEQQERRAARELFGENDTEFD